MDNEQRETEKDVEDLIEEFFGEPGINDLVEDENKDKKKEDEDLNELEDIDEDEDEDKIEDKEDKESKELEELEDKGEKGKDEEEEDNEEEKGEDLRGDKNEDEDEEKEELSLKAQNELLMKRVEELSGLQPASKKGETEDETKASSVLEFLKDGEDLDDVVSTPKLFNDVLSRVYDKAAEDVEKKILGSISPIVIGQIMKQAKLKDAIDEFFDDNEDLKIVRKTVGLMTREVMTEDPKADLETVFEKAAEKTRTMFGLRKPAAGEVKETGKRRPALRKKTRSSKNRKAIDKRTAEQKDIDDLIS